MKRWILIVLLILMGLLFIPKEGLYYSLEEILKKNEIIINNETMSQEYDSLSIESASIFYKGIKLGDLQNATLRFFGLYSVITLTDFHPSDSFFPFFPGNISTIRIQNFLWDPSHFTIIGQGDIGTFRGTIDTTTKRISLYITPMDDGDRRFHYVLKSMEKTEVGYYYESVYE